MKRHFVERLAPTAALISVVLLLVAGFALPLAAQEEAEAGNPEATEAPPSFDVDDLLADDDAVFAGEGYGYDPGTRRDPFRSLAETRERPELKGPRPDGVPGLLIAEIDLTGIFILPDGPVAQVQSASQDRSFLIRPGDKLYDGEVLSISLEEVVFRQVLDDPTALKPFREVVKQLNP